MACSTKPQNRDLMFRHTFNKDYIKKIAESIDEVFHAPQTFLNKMLFSEYDTYLDELRQFRVSLLDFVHETLIKIDGIKSNFGKRNYQCADNTRKMTFIKQRMEQIDRSVLLNFLNQCEQLIGKSIDLHKKYDSPQFKFKYIFLNSLGFLALGCIAGLCAGAVIPVLCTLCGGIIGGVVGAVYGIYRGFKQWNSTTSDINLVKQNLLDIKVQLQKIRDNLDKAHRNMSVVHDEIKLSDSCETFWSVADFEEYINGTYNDFVELKDKLLRFKHRTHENSKFYI